MESSNSISRCQHCGKTNHTTDKHIFRKNKKKEEEICKHCNGMHPTQKHKCERCNQIGCFPKKHDCHYCGGGHSTKFHHNNYIYVESLNSIPRCQHCGKTDHTTDKHIFRNNKKKEEQLCKHCNGMHPTYKHKCERCNQIGCFPKKHDCKYCGGGHSTNSHHCNVYDKYGHDSSSHQCGHCGGIDHDDSAHKCDRCRLPNHETSDHKCNKCNILGHETYAHKCSRCNRLNHDDNYYTCDICKSCLHITEDHICGLCDKKGHDQENHCEFCGDWNKNSSKKINYYDCYGDDKLEYSDYKLKCSECDRKPSSRNKCPYRSRILETFEEIRNLKKKIDDMENKIVKMNLPASQNSYV